MHAGDGLHDAAVTVGQAVAIHRFHAADVRLAELRDGNVRIAVDARGHGRGPEQLIAQVLVHELVQVEQVLQQLPAGLEGG
jgi:hypothetical protein